LRDSQVRLWVDKLTTNEPQHFKNQVTRRSPARRSYYRTNA